MKLIPLISFSIIICMNAVAQKATKDFEIELPEQKISGSLYNTISYIDSRLDTTHMGIVQLGAFNKKARVVPKIAFGQQLTNVLQALTDSASGDGGLLFQLKQLSFAEVTGAVSEKGYCYLRAVLYKKAGESYNPVNSIDTVILVKAMDVTKALFRNGSKVINSFISDNLLRPSTDTINYSYSDVVHIDSIEKRKLKLYNVTAYTDGVYKSFESFLNQAPDYTEMSVTMKRDTISSVKIAGENGKMEKIKTKNLYAVIYKGQIFVATEYGYYPVEKYNDDFLFTGKAKVTAATGDVIAASMFFGVLGGLIASDAANATFEMKIDHINGGFIRLREVK